MKRVERDREELRERMRFSVFFHDYTFYMKFDVVQSPLPSKVNKLATIFKYNNINCSTLPIESLPPLPFSMTFPTTSTTTAGAGAGSGAGACSGASAGASSVEKFGSSTNTIV